MAGQPGTNSQKNCVSGSANRQGVLIMRQAIDTGVPRGDLSARLTEPAGHAQSAGHAQPAGHVRPRGPTQPTSPAKPGTALRAEVGDTLIV